MTQEHERGPVPLKAIHIVLVARHTWIDVIRSAGRRSGCEVRQSDRAIEIRGGPAE